MEFGLRTDGGIGEFINKTSFYENVFFPIYFLFINNYNYVKCCWWKYY